MVNLRGVSTSSGFVRTCSVPRVLAVLFCASVILLAGSRSVQAGGEPFEGCGTVVIDKLYYCYMFESEADGQIYVVDGLDENYFYPGQYVRVTGVTYDCSGFCTFDACIDATEVVLCGVGCDGDLDGDGNVNVTDLLMLLADWGDCPGCEADLNDDDVVNVTDLLLLLGAWGPCA